MVECNKAIGRIYGCAPKMCGWSAVAIVLGKFPVPGRPTFWIRVGRGPTALAVGAGGVLFGHFFSRLSFLFSFSLSLGDGLSKGCLARTNQPTRKMCN